MQAIKQPGNISIRFASEIGNDFHTVFDAGSYLAKAKKSESYQLRTYLVGEGGFEPPKAVPADLQSVPFGHSGIRPYYNYAPFFKNDT